MEVHLLFEKSGQLKLNNMSQLGRLVSWSLSDFGSQFGVIVRQTELEEIVVIEVTIFILVEDLEYVVQISFLDVVHLVVP